MRNLAEHPISKDELIDGLIRMVEEMMTTGTVQCGDMRPTYLALAAGIVKESKLLLTQAEIDERKRENAEGEGNKDGSGQARS